MSGIAERLRKEFRDLEYAEGYAESYLDSYIATQIKVLRQQRGLTQAELAAAMGTKQAAISRVENVNYSSWSVATLRNLAKAFRVRLHISFESFGTLPNEVDRFGKQTLERPPHESDPALWRQDDVPGETKVLIMPPVASRTEMFPMMVGTRPVIPHKPVSTASRMTIETTTYETTFSVGKK